MSHERQKPVNDNYRDNYDKVFKKPKVRKGGNSKSSSMHRDKTKYYRPVQGGAQVPE
jgi:hypothetical protein